VYEIVHKVSKSNTNADALSHNPMERPTRQVEERRRKRKEEEEEEKKQKKKKKKQKDIQQIKNASYTNIIMHLESIKESHVREAELN